MTSLESKVLAITGAASGIGLATARLLASRNATLALADINQEPLDAAVAEISKNHASVKIYARAVDVTKSDEVASWLDETVKQFGKLDGAANLAGILGTSLGTKTQDIDDKEWNAVLSVNLGGVFNCMRAELQRIVKDGSIVNATSVAGLRGYTGGAAYSASKHAVIGLTKTASKEVGARNIRINAIAPGPIDTPLIANIMSRVNTVQDNNLSISRMGRPEEVAKLIAFLLSDESTYTTGSVYRIDGGYLS